MILLVIVQRTRFTVLNKRAIIEDNIVAYLTDEGWFVGVPQMVDVSLGDGDCSFEQALANRCRCEQQYALPRRSSGVVDCAIEGEQLLKDCEVEHVK